MVDYVNLLREGILEAYTGITQGLKGNKRSFGFTWEPLSLFIAQLLLPYMEKIFIFLHAVSQDEENTEEVTRGAIGLLGDIADALGVQVKPLLQGAWVESFLKRARGGRGFNASTKEVAKWSKTVCISHHDSLSFHPMCRWLKR